MQFIHSEHDLEAGDVVRVTLDSRANVLLMDEANFASYRQGRPYRYYGGHAKSQTVSLVPPGPGRWHVVVDLGGYWGAVRAGVSVVRAAVEAR